MSAAIMLNHGLSLRKSLESLGASRGSYYYKPKLARKDDGALRDASILYNIKQLALEKPMYGTRMMAALLSKELGRPVSRKVVQHAYRMMGWITPQMTKNEVLKRVSDKIPRPTDVNQSWQTDLTYLKCGVDGWGYLFSVIDCFSREWIAYVLSLYATKDNAIQALVGAVEKHPEASGRVVVYSDNGSQYISESFRSSMKTLGLDHKFIAYNTPEQNAYIEAFHKTLKREFVWPYDFKSFQEAEEGMARAFVDYNQSRPHSALGYLSPYEFLSRLRIKVIKN